MPVPMNIRDNLFTIKYNFGFEMCHFRFTVTAFEPNTEFSLKNKGYVEFKFDIASCEYECQLKCS